MLFSPTSLVSKARAWGLPLIALAASMAVPAFATPPKAPTNLKLRTTLVQEPGLQPPALPTSTKRYYHVTWDDNSLDESGFRVEVRFGNVGAFYLLNSVPSNTEELLFEYNFGDNVLVQFRAVAYKHNGNAIETTPSTSFAEFVSTLKASSVNAPTNFRVAEVNDGNLRFTWKDMSTAEWYYQIFYKKSGDADSTYATLGNLHLFDSKEGTANTDLTSVTVKHNLQPGQSYHFRLRATRKTDGTFATAVSSNHSAIVAPVSYPVAAATSYIVPRLNAPTELSGEAVDTERLVLRWKDNSFNETGYEMEYRAAGSTGTWQKLTLGPNSNSFTISVGPGGTYEWRVRAVVTGVSDPGDYSNVHTIVMTNFIKPQGLVATTSGLSGAIELTWQDTSLSETNYDIYTRLADDETTDDQWFFAQSMLADTTRATVKTRVENSADVPLALNVEHEFVVVARYAGTGAESEESNIAKAFIRHGFTSRTYQPAKKGQPFTYTMAVSNAVERVSWGVTGLPAGLTFDADTGIISGTPEVDGVVTCPMTVTYQTTSATVPLTLRILKEAALPTIVKDIPDITIGTGAQFPVILNDKFADADSEMAVRLRTNRGDIDLLLYPSLTPEAVENFMGYVESGAYNGVIFHRSVPTFIVQGGAYVPVGAPNVFSSLLKRPASINEPGISNIRGTVAHAKVGGNPDSATHDFFFNLEDNSLKTNIELDNQNAGFTVFARVAGSGMSVVDGIAGLPIGPYGTTATNGVILDGSEIKSNSDSTFGATPMNVSGSTAPATMDVNQTVQILDARQVSPFKYEVVDTPESHENVVRATVMNDGSLRLEGLTAGTSTITLRARDLDNNPVEQSFNVTVIKGHIAPVITRQPISVAVLPGGKASLTVTATGTNLEYQWRKKVEDAWVPIAGANLKTYSLTNIQAADTGAFSVLVGNSTSTLTSAEARVDLRTAPEVIAHPVAKVVEVGQPLVLETTVTGAPSPVISWLRSGKAVAGQKLAKLDIPAAKVTDGGTYLMRATNVAGKDESNAANVIVVDKTSRLMIALPTKTVVLKAQASGPAMNYQWLRKRTSDTQPVFITDELGRITGSNTATLTIKLLNPNDAGEYTCYVEDQADSALNGTTGAWRVGIAGGVPSLTAFTPDSAYVGIEYGFTIPGGGSANSTILSFAISGLPAGLKLDATTGRISGFATKPGEYKLKVTVKNPKGSSTLSNVPFTVLPLPEAVVGAFIGQIGNSAALNGNKGGRIDMTVTEGGLISGKLTQGKDIFSFTGKMDQNPGSISTSGQATVIRKGNTPLQMSLTALAPSGYSDSGNVTGTLTDGYDVVGFTAYRNVYNVKSRPSPEIGRFHMAFHLPTDQEGEGGIPQGTGYAVALIDSNGIAKVSGRLADGTTLTSSSFLGGQQQFLIYQSLYKNTGSFVGKVFLQEIQALTEEESKLGPRSRVEGQMIWTRDAQALATERSYKAGFGPVALYALGRTYLPTDAQPLIMGLPRIPRNASLIFAEGGVEESDTNPSVAALSIGSVPVIPSGVANAGGISLITNAATGLFSGSFKLTDPELPTPRSASYFGIIIPQIPARTYSDGSGFPQSDAGGFGFFTLAQLPSADPPTTVKTSPILSGRVNFNPVPINITQHPLSQTVNPGVSVTLTVAASTSASTPITYQWRKNGANINGATTTSYVINPVTEGAQGNYDVVVRTTYSTVISNKAVLDVNDPVSGVTVTRTPSENPVGVGNNVTFTATSQGVGPFTYQWRKNDSDILDASATGASYTLNSVGTEAAGTYSVRVSSAITPAGVTSAGNVLTVANPISAVVAQRTPTTESVNIGGNVTFSVPTISGSVGPYTYQWLKNDQNIEGATASTYVIDFVNAVDIGVYTVRVKNAITPEGVLSNAVPLDVSTAVANVNASRNPSAEGVALGTPVTFLVSTQGAGPFSFQWKKGGVNIPGATLASYSISAVTAEDTGSYTVLVSNATTPEGVLSNIVLLSVQSPVTAVGISINPNTSVLEAGQSIEFTATPNAPGPYTYQWYKNNEPISNAVDGNYLINGLQESDSGSYRVEVGNAVTASPVASQSITISVVTP
jgi:cyclophilin family peptidyl-prolyl cis-trans isomerase/predicted secreted protein